MSTCIGKKLIWSDLFSDFFQNYKNVFLIINFLHHINLKRWANFYGLDVVILLLVTIFVTNDHSDQVNTVRIAGKNRNRSQKPSPGFAHIGQTSASIDTSISEHLIVKWCRNSIYFNHIKYFYQSSILHGAMMECHESFWGEYSNSFDRVAICKKLAQPFCFFLWSFRVLIATEIKCVVVYLHLIQKYHKMMNKKFVLRWFDWSVKKNIQNEWSLLQGCIVIYKFIDVFLSKSVMLSEIKAKLSKRITIYNNFVFCQYEYEYQSSVTLSTFCWVIEKKIIIQKCSFSKTVWEIKKLWSLILWYKNIAFIYFVRNNQLINSDNENLLWFAENRFVFVIGLAGEFCLNKLTVFTW